MTDPKWRRFEKLVARVQQSLSPQAKVTHNEMIRGRKTGELRQVDVTVRTTAGQFPLLIAIDCKDLSRPATVTHVEAFAGLLDDIGANKGALVASNGFSAAAKRRATESGIDLYRLVDAEDHDWRAYVTMPILFHDLVPVGFQATLQFRREPPPGFQVEDPQAIELLDANGRSVGSPLDLVRELWKADKVTDSPGHIEDLQLSEEQLLVRHRGKLYPVQVFGDLWVERHSYFGNVPLSKISGLQNEVTGGIWTRGFTTDLLNFQELKAQFREVTDEDSLAVSPALEIEIRTML